MFSIKRIFDAATESNRNAILQVQSILRSQFPAIKEEEVGGIIQKLENPLKSRFRTILYTAEKKNKSEVAGFALMHHYPDLNFCFLDYISAAMGKTGRGLGGILYERIREEAKLLKSTGIFFECLPDDPALSPNPQIRKQNISRLKFYERYGARPIIHTLYETPLREGGTDPPYLVFDNLDTHKFPTGKATQEIVNAILTRKYGNLCPPEYIRKVVHSFTDPVIQLRSPKYTNRVPSVEISTDIPEGYKIHLYVNEQHAIHHIRERGYFESPVRIKSILGAIEATNLFLRRKPKVYTNNYIYDVHDRSYIEYFRQVCKNLPPDQPVYPYVFPIRNAHRQPRVLSVRAGYYCFDTFTPLTRNAWEAARGAVHCALSGADSLLSGTRLAYALVRPPGHHAERKMFGGFCYFNSNAIAANYLSRFGKVAILDIDYHHGNGQQDIFYSRNDVLTVSIHGHPNVAYPYFSGFQNEKGEGKGEGFNFNYPLPDGITGIKYRETLLKALNVIKRFRPKFTVIAFGLDPAKNDPTGSWLLTADDFYQNGILIGQLTAPILVVQEGGYDNRVIGSNARQFFKGLWQSHYKNLGLEI